MSGTIHCDADHDGTISAGDTPLDGVVVKATSLVVSPGQMFTDISGDAVPTSPAVPGFYRINLPTRTDDYTVQLTGTGVPSGATVLIPPPPAPSPGSAYTVNIITGNAATNHKDGVDFLIECTPPPCRTDLDCDDRNVCTDDHCDPRTGCSHTANAEPCDDGEPCTTHDTCSGGICTGGPPPDCTDSNVCTDDRCELGAGCVHDNNTAPCDDGDPCTTNDVCKDGACTPGPPKNCDDGNLCNGPELCLPDKGCVPGPPPFLVRSSSRFGNAAIIDGDIGANDANALLRLGRNTMMPDNTGASADTLNAGNLSSIFDAFSNNLVLGPGAIVRGSKGGVTLPLSAPFCLTPSLNCGGPDLVLIPTGKTVNASPGSYNRVFAPNGTSLTLSEGTYDFCSLVTGRNVVIKITGSSQSTINVRGSVKIDNESTFGPDGGTPFPLLVIGGSILHIGAHASVTALISAPNAHLSMGRTSTINGSFCVSRATTDKYIHLDCPSIPQ